MIYLTNMGNQHILILEPGNIKHLQEENGLVRSPDDNVIILYTPDILWFSKKLQECIDGRSLDVEKLQVIIKEGFYRTPIYNREYHKTVRVL